MKKLFSKLMFTAMAALTFTACEDVPEPYDIPGTGSNVPGAIEIPGGTGTGTLEDPFNTIAALNFGNKLEAGQVSKDYVYIKGKVSKLASKESDRFENNSYGNGTFYISEDGSHGNEFYVYRAMYLGNKKFASGDTPVVLGDEVVICAKITNYNGTIETNQGEGFVYELNGVNRGGEILPSEGTSEPSGDGTLENPFNATAATNKAKELASGEVSQQAYYIKGKVVSIATDKNGNILNFDQGTYGNASFYISDDGTTTGQFYCYRVLYLGNKKWTAGAGDILKEGDEVIVYAKLTMYNTTPETQQNEGFLYSLNGVTADIDPGTDSGEAKGDGTLTNPFNALAATNEAKKLASGEVSQQGYYIKGKVASIATDKNGNVQNFDYGTYGNASFYISDDGTTTNQFYCYRVLYLGNKKWTDGAGDVLKVGDEVIVYAKLTMYNSTPETQQGEGYLYSLNGVTGSDDPGQDDPTPQPSGAKGDGTLENPFNALAAINECKKLASGATTDKAYYIKGKVASIAVDKNGNVQNFDYANYGNASFYISEDGTATDQFYCYRVLYLGNKKWTAGAGDVLKEGDEVIVCAKLTMYYSTPETKQGDGYLYSLNGKTE